MADECEMKRILLEQVQRTIKDYQKVAEIATTESNTKTMYQWFAFGAITSAFLVTEMTGKEFIEHCKTIHLAGG